MMDAKTSRVHTIRASFQKLQEILKAPHNDPTTSAQAFVKARKEMGDSLGAALADSAANVALQCIDTFWHP